MMLQSNFNTVNNDVQNLIKDAQALFRSATALSGEKADDVRQRGIQLVDAAVSKSSAIRATTVEASKEALASADGYVRENPWRSIVIGAGVGLLIGALISRD